MDDQIATVSRPRTNSKRITTAVRLPADLHAALGQAALDRDLSVNYLVNRAIAEFLEKLVPADELKLTRDA